MRARDDAPRESASGGDDASRAFAPEAVLVELLERNARVSQAGTRPPGADEREAEEGTRPPGADDRAAEAKTRARVAGARVAVPDALPRAIVLACPDHRVSPEFVFDAEPGELFVVREAGNAGTDGAVASIELALDLFPARLVIVMGHTRCGAVAAAIDAGEARTKGDTARAPAGSRVGEILARIRRNAGADAAHDRADIAERAANPGESGEPGSVPSPGAGAAHHPDPDDVARRNALAVANHLDATLRAARPHDAPLVVATLYDVTTARVTRLAEAPPDAGAPPER